MASIWWKSWEPMETVRCKTEKKGGNGGVLAEWKIGAVRMTKKPGSETMEVLKLKRLS